jgi:hypothetical protein
VSHKESALMPQLPVSPDGGVPACPDPEDARDLCRQLESAGVEPLVQLKRNQAALSATAFPVDAAITIGPAAAASQLHDQVFALLARGLRLSVFVTGLAGKDDAPQLLRRVCEVLGSAARDACTQPGAIEVAVDADALNPELIWLVRRDALGEGPVYLIADGERMNPAGGWSSREHCEQFWLQLWHLRDSRALRAGCASLVSSQCPLLAAEVATSVLPSTGIQVPAGSAWVPMRLDLTRFADPRGVIHEAALEHALHCCVDIGDALHDLMEWPTAMTRYDAWLNRRLAIVISGMGDLAFCRRLDPRQFRCLEDLDQLLRWVQQTLQARSRQMARQTSCLPALDLCDPIRSLPGGEVRDDWCSRWRRAVDQGAVRHRNLMVVSAWSIFPTNRPADLHYADLLPLVAHGDACAFSRSTTLSHWNINEFKGFHQRAWAALQQRDAAALIAERV